MNLNIRLHRTTQLQVLSSHMTHRPILSNDLLNRSRYASLVGFGLQAMTASFMSSPKRLRRNLPVQFDQKTQRIAVLGFRETVSLTFEIEQQLLFFRVFFACPI